MTSTLSNLPETEHFAPASDVIATPLHDGETVLLHLGNQTYYTLNATGTDVWQGLNAGLPLPEIVQRLVDQYTVTETEAQATVQLLMQDLVAEQLVEPVCEG